MSGHNGVVDDSNGGAIPTVVLTAVASLLAAAVIVGFAVLFIIDIVQTWKGTSPPTYSAGWVYTMTGVAAAVGGLVAVFLGQSPSKVTHKEDLGANLPKAIARSGVRPYFTSGLLITWSILGIAAVVTWIAQQNISDLLHNFAVTWLGLVIPFVVAWLGGSKRG